MRTHFRSSLCVFLACIVSLHAQQSSSKTTSAKRSDQEELIQLEKKWADAGQKGDVGFFDRIAADEYMIVDWNGEIRGKQQELVQFRSEKQSSSSVDDLTVRIYGDTAVVVGRYSITQTNKGQSSTDNGRFTDVWVKRGEEWKVVSTQNTDLPSSPSESPSDSFFIEKEKEDWDALKRKDKVAASRLLADDFVGMYDGGLINKSEWLKQIDDQYSVDDYTITEARVLHPSQTTALLLYTATCKGTGAWAEFCSHPVRISDLWVERNGEWLALFSQDTTAAKNPQAAQEQEVQNQTKSATDDLKERIIANEKQVWELSAHKEMDGYSKLLTDDVLAVYSDGYASKSDVIAAISGMGTDDLHYSLDDIRVIPISDSAGLVVYKAKQDWKEGGKKLAREYYVSALWLKKDGKWQSRFWQETDTTLPDEQISAQALAKEREIQEAQKRNDWSKFADLLSDDLVAIDEDGIVGKKELLNEIKTADTRFSDYKMENVRTIPEGNGAAVAYKQTLAGTERGKPFTRHIYTHSHWQRRGDKWLLTMFQDSMAKEDVSSADSEPDEAVMKAIVANEQKIFDILKRNDIVAFGNMLPDDLIDVEDDGIHTKSEWLKEFEAQKKTGLLFTDFKMQDLRLVRYSPNAATLVFKETVGGTQNGKRFEWHINSSSGYVKRAGKWLPVLYQDVMAK